MQQQYFGDLTMHQKFIHPDFEDTLLEKVSGNAAAFVPSMPMMITIGEDEVVTVAGNA